MIKRSYFMVFRKNYTDGTSRFTEISCTVKTKSWLPDIGSTFSCGHDNATEKLSGFPGGEVFCMSFNRL